MNRFTLSALMILALPTASYAAATACPVTNAITYNQQDGCLEATSSDGVVWHSIVMPGIEPAPNYTAEKPQAFGTVSDARVTCPYKDSIGNPINLNPVDSATRRKLSTPADWDSSGEPSGQEEFFSCKTTNCLFEKVEK